MENVQIIPESPGQRDTRYAKVLLIDDNHFDNVVNGKLIEVARFAAETSVYESAEQALVFLQTAQADELPDIIFLDIIMPGMNGWQFLDAFEKLSPQVHQHCKIVMISTSDSFGDLNRANKNSRVRRFLNKPLTEEILKAIVV